MAACLAAALAGTACGAGPRPAEPERPEPERIPSREPFVRVGLEVGADSVRAGAPGGLRVTDLTAGRELETPSRDGGWLLRGDGGRVAVAGGGGGGRLRLRPRREGATLTVDGRSYRGLVDVYPVPGHGLVVVNQLDLEAYLRGVVPLEIGPRRPDEAAAVRAQAVAARTYAVANLGRRDSLGFDVFGGVLDQVYGGRGAERAPVTRAVEATEGEILVHRGRPIRAYYHSTGGGTTARVSDVWHLPDAPYLRRVSDRRPDGGFYCEASPRFRWRERWTGSELDAAARHGIAEHFGVDSAEVGAVRGVEVLARTGGDRITALEVRTEGGRWILTKDDIRFTLRTPDGRGLRSTRFRVAEGPGDGGGLRLTGRGFGHGVGMCQWGAIGRARAGQGYREILTHYYPGTELRKAY